METGFPPEMSEQRSEVVGSGSTIATVAPPHEGEDDEGDNGFAPVDSAGDTDEEQLPPGVGEDNGGENGHGAASGQATTGACGYTRPCAQQYVGKSQSCMVTGSSKTSSRVFWARRSFSTAMI